MKKTTQKDYGYKILIDDKIRNYCITVNETLKQLEYYLKFPPYYKIRYIRIYPITKKEVEEGIYKNLPWYQLLLLY